MDQEAPKIETKCDESSVKKLPEGTQLVEYLLHCNIGLDHIMDGSSQSDKVASEHICQSLRGLVDTSIRV